MFTVKSAREASRQTAKANKKHIVEVFPLFEPLSWAKDLLLDLPLSHENGYPTIEDMILATWPIDRNYKPIILADQGDDGFFFSIHDMVTKKNQRIPHYEGKPRAELQSAVEDFKKSLQLFDDVAWAAPGEEHKDTWIDHPIFLEILGMFVLHLYISRR
jgi:hypothetical protein